MTSLPLQKNFTDASGVDISYFEWPVAAPKAVIQLVHGIGEHARRYDHLAEALNRAGYSVYAEDHRGHGLTGKNQIAKRQIPKLGRTGPGGLDAVFAEVAQMGEIARSENPGLPLMLVGHSFGSYISQKLVNKNSEAYAAVVLSGSSLVMPGYMVTSGFNKKWAKTPDASGLEWLSSDHSVGKAYAADPLCFNFVGLEPGSLKDGAMKIYGIPSRNVRPDLPMLLLVGSEDPCGGERGVKALADAYRKRAGVSDISIVVYHNARHEVYNEFNKDEVIADLTSWLDGVISGRKSS
jgi:alpha-beta hydrolase superfamily lysophospholipase